MTQIENQLVDSFDDPLARLMSFHHQVLRFSWLLERIARELPEQGNSPDLQTAAGNVLECFDEAATLHHQDEDIDLLPLLLERTVGTEREEKVLLWCEKVHDEHNRIDDLWNDIREDLLAVRAGTGERLRPVDRFTELERRHVAFEDGEIFLWASQLLSTTDKAALGKAMAARRGVSWGGESDAAGR